MKFIFRSDLYNLPSPHIRDILLNVFGKFPRLVGQYCSYQLPKQALTTQEEKEQNITNEGTPQVVDIYSHSIFIHCLPDCRLHALQGCEVVAQEAGHLREAVPGSRPPHPQRVRQQELLLGRRRVFREQEGPWCTGGGADDIHVPGMKKLALIQGD